MKILFMIVLAISVICPFEQVNAGSLIGKVKGGYFMQTNEDAKDTYGNGGFAYMGGIGVSLFDVGLSKIIHNLKITAEIGQWKTDKKIKKTHSGKMDTYNWELKDQYFMFTFIGDFTTYIKNIFPYGGVGVGIHKVEGKTDYPEVGSLFEENGVSLHLIIGVDYQISSFLVINGELLLMDTGVEISGIEENIGGLLFLLGAQISFP